MPGRMLWPTGHRALARRQFRADDPMRVTQLPHEGLATPRPRPRLRSCASASCSVPNTPAWPVAVRGARGGGASPWRSPTVPGAWASPLTRTRSPMKYIRVYAGPDGESHFAEVEVALPPVAFVP